MMMSLDKLKKVTVGRGPRAPANGRGQSALAAPAQRIPWKRYSVGAAFKGLSKRRRRVHSDGQVESALPTHFLLGGNIFDPLNLNSLLDEDVNRATNQMTPKSSPLPSRSGDPVDILVPRDITDPLNLKGEGRCGGEAAGVLLSPLKSRRRHRNHHGGDKQAAARPIFLSTDGLTVPVLSREDSAAASPLPCELNTAITCREDVAPSPILPRRHSCPAPGATRKSADRRQRSRRRTASAVPAHVVVVAEVTEAARFRTPLAGGAGLDRRTRKPPEKKGRRRYEYGNCCRYYGYHGFYGNGWEGRVGPAEDARLRLLRADWFRDKKALDVGCGAGHLTLTVARAFNPVHILGVEVDGRLVRAAEQNVRHFLSHDLVEEERKRRSASPSGEGAKKAPTEEEEALRLLAFPLSLRLSRGPLAAPPLLLAAPPPSRRFPTNVSFVQGDYVSEREAWPGRGQYDVVMCLGVTKWAQLQAGDEGLARLFRRAYRSLSPGGLFILEPQPWRRYGRSKKASATTYRHYRSLQVRPEHFTSYLMDNVRKSPSTCFARSELES
ncbi:7SK snRNA methylphosphate capping enzyme-like isoform X2 [Syngnathoides biaculeatus]|uniref:7SK snRNA methylphosphate capping enzyme-like isoform X2 n=1 Tax=Syngnathoides biaculeatus TaxID=300417 RepID=UPI002ADD795C|nr:7SK snRNA methylphosphate capping enzyme-like isoform X2 [Syngnathoides biaculeatus]